MADLLIRNLDPHLKRLIAARARAHKRSLSEEAKGLLRQALGPMRQPSGPGLGTRLFSMLPDGFRTDDLEFETAGEAPEPPPDFE